MKRNKMKEKGQSTLEYLLLVTAVVAALIVFLTPGSGVFSDQFNESLSDTSSGISVMANKLRGSRKSK